MEDDDNQGKSSERLGLFFIFIFLSAFSLVLMRPIAPLIEDYYPLGPGPLSVATGMGMGKQDKDHEDLVAQVREDLKLNPSLSIKIFIGPYQEVTGEGLFIPLINPPGVIILIDQNFYQILTPEEKIAIIAHELGHLLNEEMLTVNLATMINFQIEADTYATKYVEPAALISVLDKLIERHGGVKPRDYEPRIQNLQNIRKLKQAH